MNFMSAKTVVLNAAKMNFDGKLDFSVLSDEVVLYDDTLPEQVLERVQGADTVVTKEMPVSGGIIAQFPDSVRMINEAGTGYNNLDIDAAREKGITVCNIPAYSTERVAHTAVMLLLNLSSCMQVQMRMLERGDRSNFTNHLMVSHTEVNGKTLGVIGAGRIGREVMKIALALGMEILVYTRTPRENEEHVTYCTLDEVLAGSDYITLHCPLTPQTRHIIDAAAISKMKKSACIINTARGALIDEQALIAALQEGRIAGAGLDVQETEPPAQDSPLYDMENVIITPHMGWKGLETRQRLVDILSANIHAFLDGHPQNVVS